MAKRDRDNKETVATKALKASFERVFNAFDSANAIQVIATQLKEASKNIGTTKYEEMTDEELSAENKRLQNKLRDINSEIFKRLKTSNTKKEKVEQTDKVEEEKK